MSRASKTPEDSLLEACMVIGFLAVVVGIAAIYRHAAFISGCVMLLWYAYPRGNSKITLGIIQRN